MKTCIHLDRFRALVTGIGCLVLLVNGSVLQAATITVTSTADSGPGTLRQALASAADGDTINLGVTGTITLTSGELWVTNSVAIVGPGAGILAIDGNATSRVFHVGPVMASEPKNLSISILTVTISNLTVSNGLASAPNQNNAGGGIYSSHTRLTLSDCTVSGNTADFGGGIYNGGSKGGSRLKISHCRLTGNSASFGGGISSRAHSGSVTLKLESSILSGNSASQYGGAIINGTYRGRATLKIDDCTISDNMASVGGGIFNDAVLGTARIKMGNSLVAGNSAHDGGGGFNYASVRGSATMTYHNCTITGNSAETCGGIWNYSDVGPASLKISSCTLSDNSARYVGGILNYNFGTTATVQIGNSIIDAGISGENIYNLNGAVISGGYNLSSDKAGGDAGTGPGGLLDATGDKRNTDPLLGLLQDNSGPTFTHALLPGSPAIDQGKSRINGCLRSHTDQRGFQRPVDDPNIPNAPGGDGSDIGAYEATE